VPLPYPVRVVGPHRECGGRRAGGAEEKDDFGGRAVPKAAHGSHAAPEGIFGRSRPSSGGRDAAEVIRDGLSAGTGRAGLVRLLGHGKRSVQA
jgi:hypothetical protein